VLGGKMGKLINLFLFLLLLFINTQNCRTQTTKTDSLNQILTGLKLNQSPEVIKLLEEAEQKAKKLEEETSAEIKKLQTQAVDKVKKINSLLEQNIQEIQREADEEIAQIKKSAQTELVETSLDAKNDAVVINDEFKGEILRLKKSASLKILDIINLAEEQALKIRKTEREQKVFSDLQKSVDLVALMEMLSFPSKSFNFTPITETWKTSITKEFDSNNALLQQIIIEGEVPDQINDFAQRFEQQKKWFDTTLSATKYFSDQNYNKILNKNSQLDQMATAVKKSNAILERLELSSEQKKQIRLNALYEINSMPKPISDETIQRITLDTINKINGKPQAILETKLAKIQYSQKFEEIGKEMLDLHLTNKELLDKFKQNQTAIEEESKKIKLLGEVCDLKIQEQTNLLKKAAPDKPIASPTRALASPARVKEEENRRKLELEIEILEKKR
jgi:hypothetical protein